MVLELTVTIKDEEKTLKKDYLIYDPVVMDWEDRIISQCLQEVIKEFIGEPQSVKIKAVMHD